MVRAFGVFFGTFETEKGRTQEGCGPNPFNAKR
jgi:hypothetical protein